VTCSLLIGDVFDRMHELEDHSFDLIITSPPFLALRSYLPADHPDKDKEIGSEATPAEYLDVLLALTAEWRRLLAPHGSIAIELGDTYAGSGGAGGDYGADGLRDGQARFDGSAKHQRAEGRTAWERDHPIQLPREHVIPSKGPGWPLDKSLTGIPTLYTWSLAYGRNLLTGQPSPAGQWRIRNLKPWIRTNPPVGAPGGKERPATSYITVACTGRDRWFDLDAVRTPAQLQTPRNTNGPKSEPIDEFQGRRFDARTDSNPGGAPPLDWWHQVDALIDDELDRRAGRTNGCSGGGISGPRGELTIGAKQRGLTKSATISDGDGYNHLPGSTDVSNLTVGARGPHIRRRLEAAGYLTTLDAYDISPRGYTGAHYAVWPPELVQRLVDEMCPRRVCTVCGEPSRRITAAFTLDSYRASSRPQTIKAVALADAAGLTDEHIAAVRAFGTSDAGKAPTINNGAGKNTDEVKQLAAEAKAVLGGYFREFVQTTTAARDSSWSDCGHGTWHPGRILDPFVGSGTTLAVASGMSRDSVGIDLDIASYGMAIERVGPLLFEIDWPEPNYAWPTLPPGDGDYTEWAHMAGDQRTRIAAELGFRLCWFLAGQPPDNRPEPDPVAAPQRRHGRRPIVNVPGQAGMFEDTVT
jgi:hypothetical protein